MVYEEEEYDPPKEILERMRELEKEIMTDMEELRGMLGMNREVFRLKAKCPANWDILQFDDAIKDAASGKPKVEKGSYKQKGFGPER